MRVQSRVGSDKRIQKMQAGSGCSAYPRWDSNSPNLQNEGHQTLSQSHFLPFMNNNTLIFYMTLEKGAIQAVLRTVRMNKTENKSCDFFLP